MNCGIYKILNLISGKFYIGSAISITDRWDHHRHTLRKCIHTNSYLQRAWIKYGNEAFEFIILELCQKEKLIEREQYWLDETKCWDKSIGYNILKLAYSGIGSKRSAESKARMSVAQKGKIMPIDGVEKMRAAKRNIVKWPHADGSRCKCHKCNYKKSEYSLYWKKAKKLKQAQNVQV